MLRMIGATTRPAPDGSPMDDHWPRYLGLLLDAIRPGAATALTAEAGAEADLLDSDLEAPHEGVELLGGAREVGGGGGDLLRRGEVSCVEAETCSAEADDCSATAATSATRSRHVPARRRSPRPRRRSRRSARPCPRPRRRCAGTPRGSARRWRRPLRCARRPRRRRRRPRASGPASRRSARRSRRRAAGTPRRACGPPRRRPRSPRPCSPARAASIAALSASRLVCSAMPVIVVDDAADALGAGGEVLDRRADLRGGVRDLRIASVACPAAATPSRATRARVLGGLGGGVRGWRRSPRRRGRTPARRRGWTRPCAPGARRPGRRR